MATKYGTKLVTYDNKSGAVRAKEFVGLGHADEALEHLRNMVARNDGVWPASHYFEPIVVTD